MANVFTRYFSNFLHFLQLWWAQPLSAFLFFEVSCFIIPNSCEPHPQNKYSGKNGCIRKTFPAVFLTLSHRPGFFRCVAERPLGREIWYLGHKLPLFLSAHRGQNTTNSLLQQNVLNDLILFNQTGVFSWPGTAFLLHSEAHVATRTQIPGAPTRPNRIFFFPEWH